MCCVNVEWPNIKQYERIFTENTYIKYKEISHINASHE